VTCSAARTTTLPRSKGPAIAGVTITRLSGARFPAGTGSLRLELPGALDLLRKRGSPDVPVIALINRYEDAGVLMDDSALRVDDSLRRPFGFEDPLAPLISDS
jgi:hypothetical protein